MLLALVGVVTDFARLYQMWTNLESATRDAAQYLATSNTDPANDNYTWEGEDADTKAMFVLEQATGITFTRSPTQGTLTDCSRPQLTTTYAQDTSWSQGASTATPLSTAKVLTCLPFRTLFAYPFLTVGGDWILRSEREMRLLVGR